MKAIFSMCRFLIFCCAYLLIGCEESTSEMPCVGKFEKLKYQIDENSPAGAVVGKLPTEEEVNTTRYVIASGNFGNTFAINLIDAKIIVSNSRLLDYEERKSFELTVIGYGPTCATSMATVMIQIGNLND